MAMAQAETPCPERLVRVARMEVPATNDAPLVAAIFSAQAFDLRAAIPVYADRLLE